MITDDDFRKALDRFARTADGGLVYLYLQSIVMAVPPLDCPDSTLRSDQGRRTFAADLMGQMAKGIDESGGRIDSTDGKPTERAVVIHRGGAGVNNAGKHTSFREHARLNDPELRGLSSGDGSGR